MDFHRLLVLLLLLLRHGASGPSRRGFLASASALPGWVVRQRAGGWFVEKVVVVLVLQRLDGAAANFLWFVAPLCN